MNNNNNIEVKGCGCRYRGQECDHLCDMHKDEFILKLYNHDRNTITWKKMIDAHRQGYEEWKKVSDAMYEQHMKR